MNSVLEIAKLIDPMVVEAICEDPPVSRLAAYVMAGAVLHQQPFMHRKRGRRPIEPEIRSANFIQERFNRITGTLPTQSQKQELYVLGALTAVELAATEFNHFRRLHLPPAFMQLDPPNLARLTPRMLLPGQVT